MEAFSPFLYKFTCKITDKITNFAKYYTLKCIYLDKDHSPIKANKIRTPYSVTKAWSPVETLCGSSYFKKVIMRKSIVNYLLSVASVAALSSCCGDICPIPDPHFESDGTFISDSSKSISPVAPNRIKFYVEVSGSMNGFFRANKTTDFKKDVWQILSYYSALAPEIRILTNDGSMGTSYPQSQFQTMMNTGAFVSSASTRVPTMLESIFSDLKTEEGEVAVLISDMKYSPVGLKAPDVLMSQYSTDISEKLGKQKKAVSLVGATSNYLDKAGNTVTEQSPYYFFIIGEGDQVAFMRNGISTMLDNNKHFIDNIESGFDYGMPTCSFGIPENCYQMNDTDPTFVDFDQSSSDTCSIKMEIHLEGYRWIVATEPYFENAFKIKPLYGSNIEVGKIDFRISNITDKELVRTATAMVDVKVFDMPMDADVLEWSLELPDTDITSFAPYFDGATDEADPTKSYSVPDFIKGIFYGGVVNKTLKPNYILISKNS